MSACVAAVYAFAFVAACGGASLPVASEGDAARVRARWPGVTAGALNEGRALYVGHCGSCHLPVAPTELSAEAWPAQLDEMRERAGLTRAESDVVERYLITMAQAQAPAPPR